MEQLSGIITGTDVRFAAEGTDRDRVFIKHW